ncbi:MAG: DUF6516 family protein [Anaerolineae bacterium]
MRATSFPDYARDVTNVLNRIVAANLGRLADFQIDQRSMLRGLVAGILFFNDESQLHFREYVDLTLDQHRIMYAYHYQDAASKMVFRYDNAAHRPALAEPEHKHTIAGVVLAAPPPLEDVITEALTYVSEGL